MAYDRLDYARDEEPEDEWPKYEPAHEPSFPERVNDCLHSLQTEGGIAVPCLRCAARQHR